MTKSAMKQPLPPQSDTTSTSSDSSDQHRPYKCVYFGDISISEYPLIMGDNPNCTGVPLQLAWKPSKTEIMDIDLYEYARDPRRTKRMFHMTDVDREIYLLSQGYGMNDIIDTCEQGRKIRKERYNSFHGKKWDRFRVVMESAKQTLTLESRRSVSATTA